MSSITGAGFTSGAAGAGLNEAVIKEIDKIAKHDPGMAQIVSAIVGAAAAKAVGGNAGAGAAAAASGTKWNFFLMEYPNFHGVGALAQHILIREDGKEFSPEEVLSLVQGMNNVFSEAEPERANAQNMQSENINNYPKAISYLMSSGVTKESAIHFFKEYNTLLRKQNWNVYSIITDDVHVSVDERTKKPIEDIQIPRPKLSKETLIEPYPPAVFTGENLVLPNTPLTTHEKKTSPGAITTPRQENHGGEANDQSKAALGKTVANTEERIHWGRWQHNPRIAENPKEDTEQEHSDEDNTATTIQKNDVNNKDSKGNRSNDKQGEKTRGNSTETTGNPKDNSKKENTDPNREKRVELGKTIGIETFKFGGDLPVTLLNKQADSLAKEYRSLQKEIPAYVVKQGRLTKVGVLSPLGLIYDTYQDAQKYNGGKFVGAVAINTGAFVGTILLDSALTSTGVGAIGVIPTNVFVAEGTTWLKEKVLDEPKVEEKH